MRTRKIRKEKKRRKGLQKRNWEPLNEVEIGLELPPLLRRKEKEKEKEKRKNTYKNPLMTYGRPERGETTGGR